MKKHLAIFLVFLCTLTACKLQDTTPPVIPIENPVSVSPTSFVLPAVTEEPTETPIPPRALTVCMGQEPGSLFLYGDTSSAAQAIRQAIYDGPSDTPNYEVQPVILEKIPSLSDGDAFFRPVEVEPGELIVDARGKWVSLQSSVSYRPSGCTSVSCAQTFEGQDPILMDELVAQFRLIPGIQWSDGAALTAADSVYSFDVFRSLFAGASPETLRYTRSYSALDEGTVEWVSIPGYLGSFATNFFTPLPEHIWGLLPASELYTAEFVSRTPIGWGPYVIDEWVAGDHISLHRNPLYFRAIEGLPLFDLLVFRFVSNGSEAIDALVVGECDYIDRTALLETDIPRLLAERNAGNLEFSVQVGTAWDLIAFGIEHLDEQRLSLFRMKEVRQAVAMCIDRQQIVDTFFFGETIIPDIYVAPDHPLSNPDVRQYEYNPGEASNLLTEVGWMDQDADPGTPRISEGVPDVPDGTPFVFEFWVPNDAERPAVAQMVKDSLAECGIKAEVISEDWDTLFEPGPQGLIFGRQFDLVQLSWAATFEPACYLYTSDQIPGPYPEYPMGWGGGNLSGYRNSDFDQYCIQAMASIPGSEEYISAHYSAQEVFAEEIPAIPLYERIALTAMRVDMCGVPGDIATTSALSFLENFDYGNNCNQ
jgi:peptide/nickel transport system substrate-binding protein